MLKQLRHTTWFDDTISIGWIVTAIVCGACSTALVYNMARQYANTSWLAQSGGGLTLVAGYVFPVLRAAAAFATPPRQPNMFQIAIPPTLALSASTVLLYVITIDTDCQFNAPATVGILMLIGLIAISVELIAHLVGIGDFKLFRKRNTRLNIHMLSADQVFQLVLATGIMSYGLVIFANDAYRCGLELTRILLLFGLTFVVVGLVLSAGRIARRY